METPPDTCQQRFFQRWDALQNPHVRALAWLVDSPDLLDAAHSYWQGKIATLPAPDAAWLSEIDRDPSALQTMLGERSYTRLGLYAEKLMAFYFQARGQLLAHSLQVRAAHNETVGEFDFLLDDGDGAALHIELATKFYLLNGMRPEQLDDLVGPNLADSLGAKMRKITSKQLELAAHPAAAAVLPRPVSRSQALVKGWLFYPEGAVPGLGGLNPQHCHGQWLAAGELADLRGEAFALLPRIEWLAPYKGKANPLNRAALADVVRDRFADTTIPLLVAVLEEEGGWWREVRRAFIVPDDWRARAAAL